MYFYFTYAWFVSHQSHQPDKFLKPSFLLGLYKTSYNVEHVIGSQ